MVQSKFYLESKARTSTQLGHSQIRPSLPVSDLQCFSKYMSKNNFQFSQLLALYYPNLNQIFFSIHNSYSVLTYKVTYKQLKENPQIKLLVVEEQLGRSTLSACIFELIIRKRAHKYYPEIIGNYKFQVSNHGPLISSTFT